MNHFLHGRPRQIEKTSFLNGLKSDSSNKNYLIAAVLADFNSVCSGRSDRSKVMYMAFSLTCH